MNELLRPGDLQKLSSILVAECVVGKIQYWEKTLVNNSGQNEEELWTLTLKKNISALRLWWKNIPGIKGQVGCLLQWAVDEVIEKKSFKSSRDSRLQIMFLLVKLLFLDSVYFDRDYKNTFGLCSISYQYENLACDIFNQYQFCPKKLVVYGAIYPSILQTVLANCKGLNSLSVSQINVTDDLMLYIRSCKDLEILHLNHSYIWMAISREALCKGLFQGQNEREVSNSFEKGFRVPLTFPKLRVLDIGASVNEFIKDFSKWVHFYYNIESISFEWKTDFLQQDQKFMCSRLIVPLINKSKQLKIDVMCMEADFLHSLSKNLKDKIISQMPNLRKLCIDCNVSDYSNNTEKDIARDLMMLIDNSKVTNLVINIPSQPVQFPFVAKPLFGARGFNLASLTITSDKHEETIDFRTFVRIINECPNLRVLKLLLYNRCCMKYDEEGVEYFIKTDNKLEEIWYHELAPWDISAGVNADYYSQMWIRGMENLLKAFKYNPKDLSLTICEGTSKFISSSTFSEVSVSNLHIHVKDGCEWNVDVSFLLKIVHQFKKLIRFYIEEIEGENFWKLKQKCYWTNLEIIWGNFGGWPRT